MTRKLLVQDARGERELLMVGRMAVGRDPRCEISDPDPLLSRRHAEFTEEPHGVRVRDLHSRNGLQVNGLNVNEAVLHSGDVVRIARLTIRYTDDAAVPTTADDDDPDNTIVVPPPTTARSAAPRAATAVVDDEDDGTRVVPPPTAPPAAPGPKTSARRPPPSGRHPRATPAAARTGTAKPRSPWGRRVSVRVVALSVGVFAAAAFPLWVWQQRVIDRVAVSRATAVGRWLAASAAAADDAGAVQDAVQGISTDASVVSAVVVGLDGRVVSPPSRATETVASIPGIGGNLPSILLPRAVWSEGLVEVVVPVNSRRRGHIGLAWLTIRPAALPEAASGSFIVLAPALVCALVGGFLVSLQIQRITLHGLTALNQDMELALSGHLASVGDTLNARPVADLTDTLNYLLARNRVASAGAATEAGTPGAERPVAAAPTAPVALEATLIADISFRVQEATPRCLELLGVKPDALIGKHLLDAVGEGPLGDAVLRCLAGLHGAGESRAAVPSRGLMLSISRSAQDAPVIVTFLQATESAR